MGNVAIHGFGRIGRSTLKVALQQGLFVTSVISDIKDPSVLSDLFAFDSNYGRWPDPVTFRDNKMVIGGKEILFVNTAESLPDWAALGVDIVIDCTGRATVRSGAEAHLKRGAKVVLVSAASKSRSDCDVVLLPGINLDSFDPERHQIVSMASCTTNALAPVVQVLKSSIGIQSGFFSTVHAYTNTQSLTDQPMKDRRDSWAATENIIPSTSGAAKALNFIWPDLVITGKAYRVPVRTGSIVELTIVSEKETNEEEIKNIFREHAAAGPLKGVMGVLEGEYASSRILGETLSSVVDLPLVQVLGGRLVSVAAWYDNEMGYSTRLAEMAHYIARRLK